MSTFRCGDGYSLSLSLSHTHIQKIGYVSRQAIIVLRWTSRCRGAIINQQKFGFPLGYRAVKAHIDLLARLLQSALHAYISTYTRYNFIFKQRTINRRSDFAYDLTNPAIEQEAKQEDSSGWYILKVMLLAMNQFNLNANECGKMEIIWNYKITFRVVRWLTARVAH